MGRRKWARRRKWANWTHLYNARKGQAMLELAIFGSILIMLLGILVNYGLKYNFQQQVMQQAFRKALGIASDKGSATYVLIRDRHIPDPGHPFAIGSVVPTSSSASVVRDYRMHWTPDTEEELPVMHLDSNGDIYTYKLAGFKSEPDEDIEDINIEDIIEVMDGYSNISDYFRDFRSMYIRSGYKINDEDAVIMDYIIDYVYDYIADKPGNNIIGYIQNYKLGHVDMEYIVNCIMNYVEDESIEIEDIKDYVKITSNIDDHRGEEIDYNAGEIMNYDSCKAQCEESGDTEWYCDKLDQLFPEERPMGLQTDYTQNLKIKNSRMKKQEEKSAITTTDTIHWENEITRTFVYRPYGDTSGNTEEQPIPSKISRDKTYQWQTNW